MLQSRQKRAVTSKWQLFDSKLIDEVRNTRLKEFRNVEIKENAWKAIASERGSTGMYNSSTQNKVIFVEFTVRIAVSSLVYG